MATTQLPQHPAYRMSSGKDILSRMLQMEKQSRQRRSSSTSPQLPPSPKLDYVSPSTPKILPSPIKSPKSPSAKPQSPLRPAQITRSQTTPNFIPAADPLKKPQLTEKTMPLTLTTDIAPEEKPVEICLSPSWSDHGEKARKREKRRAEKDQKERQKKLRQDEERQKEMELKAGKRLSKKPPPAAMETQKMPTSLRRNSWVSFMSSQSSSGENTRRSSREEKRSSGMSFSSIRSRRSQSTPGTNIDGPSATSAASETRQPIVSASAPKLPSFRWSSSRRTSSDHIKSASSGSDDSYDKDLITFAYRLDVSDATVGPERVIRDRRLQDNTGAATKKPSAGHSSSNDSDVQLSFKSVPYESVSSKSPQRSPTRKTVDSEIQLAKSHPSQASPGFSTKKKTPSLSVAAPSPTRPFHDGSSYVHKQRMYQQQQFIAGFEDQQAIQDATQAAYELAAESETSLDKRSKATSDQGQANTSSANAHNAPLSQLANPLKKDASISPVYTRQRDRSTSPQKESSPAKFQSTGPTSPLPAPDKAPESMAERRHAPSPTAEESVSQYRPQVPANFKTDRILGFRRRTKQPPALVSIPYNAENQIVAVQSTPLNDQENGETAVKRSRIERLFKEPKPAFADKDRRSSSSCSQSRVKELSPESKITQSHSRTRTASSTVLNDSTATSIIGPATQPKNPHTGQSSAVIEPNFKSRADPDVKASKVALPKSSSPAIHDAKTGKKQTRQVVVASETGEGIVRKTSIKRPRSNPQLQMQTTASKSSLTADSLPPLKHQPLIKRERQSPTRPIAQYKEHVAPLNDESPNAPDLKLIPRSPLRPPSQFPVPAGSRFNRSSTEVGTASFGKGTLVDGFEAKPVAKLFVICCKCKFWHDLPSKLYEAMALPLELHKADKGKVAGARLETAVKCPWCEHAMTTDCCQGWTTVVYMHERHH